jgi:N-acetylglucosaminylphosphatidylinositol deacetylase
MMIINKLSAITAFFIITASIINMTSSHKIPTNIHQVWIGEDYDNHIEMEWQQNSAVWRELHPNWTYHLWDEVDCRKLVETEYEWFLRSFDSIKQDIQIADVCRYFILDSYGGFYADLDMRPQISFEAIVNEAYLKKLEVIFLERSPSSQKGTSFYGSYLAIGLMGSIPRAAFWKNVFQVLTERCPGGFYFSDHHQVMHQTGPNLIMTAYWRYHKMTPGLGVFAHQRFYPCDVVCMSDYEVSACNLIQKDRPYKYPIIIGAGKSWNKWFTHCLNFLACNLPLNLIGIFVFITISFLVFYIVFFRMKRQNAFLIVMARIAYFLVMPVLIYRNLGRYRTSLSMACVYIQIVVAFFYSKWPNMHHKSSRRITIVFYALILWTVIFCIYNHYTTPEPPVDKKVLFITAHPDDESMFFSPTISSLREAGWELHILCMSHSGDIRKEELRNAVNSMGFRYSNVHIRNYEDGFDSKLNLSDVADDIVEVAKDFDMIVSFDGMGVTQHPNHIAVYQAYRKAAKRILNDYPHTKLLVLDSMSPLTRFLGPIPFIFTYLKHFIFPDTVVIYGNVIPYESWRGMSFHESQWIWYRKLNVVFSSHHYYNELAELYSLENGDRTYDESFIFVKNLI